MTNFHTVERDLLASATGGTASFFVFPKEACKTEFHAYNSASVKAGMSDGPGTVAFDRLYGRFLGNTPEPLNPRHPEVKSTQDTWQACERRIRGL